LPLKVVLKAPRPLNNASRPDNPSGQASIPLSVSRIRA
jgi:hypothetical protein